MMAPGENRFSPTMWRQMPVLAQSQTPAGGIDETTVTAPAGGIDEITVTGTRSSGDDISGNFNSSDQLDEITVLVNRGERNWEGKNPNPPKGVKPIRDPSGKIVGWIEPTPDGKGKKKPFQWGLDNGLNPNNFPAPPALPQLQSSYIPPPPDSGAVTLAWLLSVLVLFNQFDAYTTVP